MKHHGLYHNHFTVPYLTKVRMKRVAEFWELVECELLLVAGSVEAGSLAEAMKEAISRSSQIQSRE